jgi:uncharacterized phiE125 gp8 family phage protein
MALDTLSNIKTALMITTTDDDDVLERIMETAEAFIQEHTGRTFAGGTFTEDHAGGFSALFLRNFPIASVTSVKADSTRQFGSDTVLPADRYFAHRERGVLEATCGLFLPVGPGTLRVVYTTATGQVPGVIKEAFAQLVAYWYRIVKTQVSMTFQSMTSQTDTVAGTTTEYPWNLSTGAKLPPGVLQLLQRFRVPQV